MNTQTLPRPKTLLSKAQLSTAQLSKALLPRTAPRAAFGKIILNEARLAWRLPAGLIFGVAVPLLLVIIFGEIPGMHQPQASMGGLTLFPVYIPILISMAIAILALISLPAALVSYRDQGILRRLSTTPVPPSWMLAAQLVINFCIIMTSLLIVIVVSITAFGLGVPKNPGALVLAIVLSIAALFAIGLCIAAAARSGTAARAIGAAAFYPMLFFAGMWFPREMMPVILQDISNFTPLGAAVEAMQDSMQGQFPPAEPLLVLVGYALVFAFIARRFFRWD